MTIACGCAGGKPVAIGLRLDKPEALPLDWRVSLADEQRAVFERDGFVAVRGFLSADELAEVERELASFFRDRLAGLPAEHVFLEDKSQANSLKQIQRLHEHSEFFGGLMDGKPRALAERLLGEPARGINLQYFNKAPGMNQQTPPHQDGFYFMLEPCRAATLWLALDMVDEENGCVRYVRGSQSEGLRPHQATGTLGFSQGVSDYEEADEASEVVCPAEPGDLLAHHALTIHRAGGNASATRERRALGFIFYGESAREDAPAHGAYQARLADQLREAGRI